MVNANTNHSQSACVTFRPPLVLGGWSEAGTFPDEVNFTSPQDSATKQKLWARLRFNEWQERSERPPHRPVTGSGGAARIVGPQGGGLG